MPDIPNLSKDPYGHHVVERMLEHAAAFRPRIIEVLSSNLSVLASNPAGSYVIEQCFSQGSPEDQLRLVQAALSCHYEGLSFLACNQFGFHVVKAILQLQDKEFAHVYGPVLGDCWDHLNRYERKLKRTQKGL